jgi:hypothetical protein
MSLSDREFLLICEMPREVLIETVIRLWEELESMKTPIYEVSLPPVPECGEYIVLDAEGAVRFRGNEADWDLRDVETVACGVSMQGYCAVQFVLCGVVELISEWSRGVEVARCK